MNHPHIDENSDAFWVGRMAVALQIALTALQTRNISYARVVLDRELREFRASPLACEEVMNVLRSL